MNFKVLQPTRGFCSKICTAERENVKTDQFMEVFLPRPALFERNFKINIIIYIVLGIFLPLKSAKYIIENAIFES
jgi:hypothetical protein